MGQDDPEDYNLKTDKMLNSTTENDRDVIQPGRSAASSDGEFNMTGEDEMLEEVGITKNENPLRRVNEMFYGAGNDGMADRYDSFMGKSQPTIGVKNKHEELGLAEYDGFQFLTEDGQTLKNELERLSEETNTDVGQALGILTRDQGAKNTDELLEMYQEIESNDYQKQRNLANEVGMRDRAVSIKLKQLENEGLVDRENSIELTEDGYEVFKSIRGIESYVSHK